METLTPLLCGLAAIVVVAVVLVANAIRMCRSTSGWLCSALGA